MIAHGTRAVSILGSELTFPLANLEKELVAKPYILGDRFTVADLNVSIVLSWVRDLRVCYVRSFVGT